MPFCSEFLQVTHAVIEFSSILKKINVKHCKKRQKTASFLPHGMHKDTMKVIVWTLNSLTRQLKFVRQLIYALDFD